MKTPWWRRGRWALRAMKRNGRLKPKRQFVQEPCDGEKSKISLGVCRVRSPLFESSGQKEGRGGGGDGVREEERQKGTKWLAWVVFYLFYPFAFCHGVWLYTVRCAFSRREDKGRRKKATEDHSEREKRLQKDTERKGTSRKRKGRN